MLKRASRPAALIASLGAFVVLCLVLVGWSHGDYRQLLGTAAAFAPGTLTEDQIRLVDDSPTDPSIPSDTTSSVAWSDDPNLDPPFAPGVGLTPSSPTTAELTDDFPLDVGAPNASRQARFPSWHTFEHAFVFGDSYSDTFFDFVRGPYPTEQNLLGNDVREAPRGTPNPKWINFLVDDYSRNHSILTYNFALSGAMVTNELMPSWLTSPTQTNKPVEDQISRNFETYCGRSTFECPWTPETSLFFVFAGINDVFAPYFIGTDRRPLEVLPHYYKNVRKLYSLGARNFVFMNVPPLDQIGEVNEYTAHKREDVLAYNARLLLLRNAIVAELPDINTRLFDTRQLYADVIRAPESFEQTKGMTQMVRDCFAYAGTEAHSASHYDALCAAPYGEYMWHDFVHATYRVHNATAAAMMRDCFEPEAPRGYCS